MLGTNLSTTLSNVTITNTISFLQISQPIFSIQWVHLQRCRVDIMTRTNKIIMQMMITQHMTDILAQKALNTLTKFLYTIDIFLLHFPSSIFKIRRSRTKLLDLLLNLVIPRNVCHKILNVRKSTHRLNSHRFIKWQII